MKTVITKKRNVYGNELIYPITFSQEICALTGQKTLSQSHIDALKSLGVNVVDERFAVVSN